MPLKFSLKAARRAAGLLVILGGSLLAFQNCGRISMVKSASSTTQLSPVLSMSEFLVETTLNHAKSVQLTSGSSGSTFSFDSSKPVLKETLTHASLTIDGSTGLLTFTPNTGFRGSVQVTVYSTTQNITNVQNITFQVDNPLLSFKPALAVRGPMCLLCHANMQGDLITDFGFKSATETGPDLFLTTLPTPATGYSIYSPTIPGQPSISTASIVGHLVIPNIQFASLDPTITRSYAPVNPMSLATPITNVKDFITTEENITNTGFAGIQTQSNVYVGAPTASDITTASAGITAGGTKFYPNTVTDPAVSGLTHVQSGAMNYYTTSGTLTCEGDLFVDGVVYFDHIKVATTYGCRIYATRSVFINGPITYTNVSALSNMQISSAIGIYMGFGYCIDCDGSITYGFKGQSTLQGRLNDIYNNYSAVTSYRTMSVATNRDAAFADAAQINGTPPALPATLPTGAALTAYYQNLKTQYGVQMFDASNSFIAEAPTTYSRLLLNAPVVMSRYQGDYQGIVIAEFALWRLGAFTFTFDPVFTGVALLPFLDFTKILNIQ